MPLAYMRFTKLQLLLDVELRELWLQPPEYSEFRGTYHYAEEDSLSESSLLNLVEEIFAMQQPLGSFGICDNLLFFF